jgi:hypothetical protein
MKLVNIDIIAGKNGEIVDVGINPYQIVMVMDMNVPGKLKDAEGQPIMENKLCLDMGSKILITNLTRDEFDNKIAEVDDRIHFN